MATTLSPYLNFEGNTREAMEFYHSVFGGTLDVLTFGDFHMDQMPADGVMHAALKTDEFSIFASEAMPGSSKHWDGTRVYLAVMGDDHECLAGWFDQLADGGRVDAPLQQQVWGDLYGQVTDRFGIEWMFNVAGPAGGDGGASA